MLNSLRELYRYRALVAALVARHLALRYRGSALGFLWSLLNPLCLMLVYTLVFKYYIRFNEVPNYTIFLFCGLLPWIWITSGLSEGASAIVTSGHLITKSMFPAHILPAVAVITSLVNFLLSLPMLFVFMLVLGVPMHASLVFVPVVIALQFLLLLGAAVGLGSLNVLFRDVQHLLANVLSFLFFLCPIVYPASSVPDRFRFTLSLNPFAQLTVMYHDLILDGVVPPALSFFYVALWVGAALLAGYLIFARYRESFAELL
jgi:ABC-type polysaccharide/polyol phosphate export permease